MDLSNSCLVKRVVSNLIIMYTIVLVPISCPSFKRNPNLRLLLKEEGYTLLNPRWTESGWIYYIKCDYEASGNYGAGEVWKITVDGQQKESVFSESVIIMDISPSETLLIAFRSQDYDAPLILYNIKTAEVETLLTAYYPNFAGLQFGSSDTLIYYSDNDGLHRVNIFSKNDTVIVSDMIYYFDTYHDSLLYYNQKIVNFSNGAIVYESSELMKGFFTQNKDSLLFVAEWEEGLQLYDIKTGEKFELDARPYEISMWADRGNCIDFNPLDSKQIIFSAVESCPEGFVDEGFELWILEKF